MRKPFPFALWSVLSVSLMAAGTHTVRAEDAASVACARPLDAALVKDIIKSTDPIESKVQQVVMIAKASAVNGWASIPRSGDIQRVVAETVNLTLAQLPSPVPAAELETTASAVATGTGDALNAACALPAANMAALKAAAFAAAGLPVAAAAATAVDEGSGEPVDIKTSGDAYGVGDRLRFYTETDGFSLVQGSQATTPAIAPCGAKFRVTNVDQAGENILGYFYSLPEENLIKGGFKRERVGSFRGRLCPPESLAGVRVRQGKDYQIAVDRLARAPAYVSGYQFGVLVAPYKFHFSDDSTTPSATIGGYFGFQFGSPSVTVTPVFSVGLGAVTETDPPEAVEGEEQTEGTLATLSAATGVLFTIRKAGGFTVGLLFGSDWTGQKERYRYDGKLWAAISLGMAITK